MASSIRRQLLSWCRPGTSVLSIARAIDAQGCLDVIACLILPVWKRYERRIQVVVVVVDLISKRGHSVKEVEATGPQMIGFDCTELIGRSVRRWFRALSCRAWRGDDHPSVTLSSARATSWPCEAAGTWLNGDETRVPSRPWPVMAILEQSMSSSTASGHHHPSCRG